LFLFFNAAAAMDRWDMIFPPPVGVCSPCPFSDATAAFPPPPESTVNLPFLLPPPVLHFGISIPCAADPSDELFGECVTPAPLAVDIAMVAPEAVLCNDATPGDELGAIGFGNIGLFRLTPLELAVLPLPVVVLDEADTPRFAPAPCTTRAVERPALAVRGPPPPEAGE